MTKTEKKFVKIEKGAKVEIVAIEPFQHNSPEYKCCCGILHFKKAALAIGLLVILVGLIGITLSAVWNYWWTIIPFALAVVLGVLILYAHKTEKQNFYLPLVIVNLILIVAAFLFVILGIVLIIFVPKWSQNFVENVQSTHYNNRDDRVNATRIFFAIFITVLLAFIAIATWFTWVVYKSFMYMRDMHLARHPYKFLYTNGIKDGLEHVNGMQGGATQTKY